MRTSIYVDGFNFYYGCFKHQRHLCSPKDKWLDWRTLGERLVGADSNLHHVHYFTAHIRREPNDPEQGLRQERLLKAMEATPGLQLHFGKHIPVTRRGKLEKPSPNDLGWPPEALVTVRTFEEKGSDVNLAVHLLNDAWTGTIDRAIVVSNDTDLRDAITLARRHIRVDVASPQPSLAKELRKVADYSWCIDASILRECRMPIPRIARDGSVLLPPDTWERETWPAKPDEAQELRNAICSVAEHWHPNSRHS